jgi:UDP-glucose 4-epimerase
MRCLVTGGCGFIGAALVRELLAREASAVVVVDNLSWGSPAKLPHDGRVSLVRADVLDRGLPGVLAPLGPFDEAYHLAALPFVPFCEANPEASTAVMVDGTRNLLDAMARTDPPQRLFFSSTVAVYGLADEPRSEQSPCKPVGVYARAKLDAEQLVLDWGTRRRLERVIVSRYANVFGPGETKPHIVPTILAQLERGARTVSLGNTASRRDFVHVDDVAEASVRLMRAPGAAGAHVVNIGTGRSRSIDEMLQVFESILGEPLSIVRAPHAVRRSDPDCMAIDVTRARELAGWSATRSLEAELKKLMEAAAPALGFVQWHLRQTGG